MLHDATELDNINKIIGLTIDDILYLTPKFWQSHMDAIIIRDIVAHILFSIQYNLVAGTIAPYAMKRPDLQPVMKKILNFDVSYDIYSAIPLKGTRSLINVQGLLYA